MGREAVTTATYDGRTDEAKALLESQGVLLRAPFSLTIPRDGISGLAVEGETLTGQGPRGRFESAPSRPVSGSRRWRSPCRPWRTSWG